MIKGRIEAAVRPILVTLGLFIGSWLGVCVAVDPFNVTSVPLGACMVLLVATHRVRKIRSIRFILISIVLSFWVVFVVMLFLLQGYHSV